MPRTVPGNDAPEAGWDRLCTMLLDISCAPFDDRDATLERLMSAAAEALGVERVGLWLYGSDRESLRCEAMWVRGEGFMQPAHQIFAATVPAYFAALESELTIDADDARNDPRTFELDQGYHQPNRIGALLDVPVRRFGETVGVLCNEHVGGPRPWSAAERLFSAALAAAVSQLLEHVRFREAVALRDQALFYDGPTGLPNRALFLDRLTQRLGAARRGRLGLICVDIDHYADFQRGASEAEAERLIAAVASRLATLLPGERLGRVAPDEFAMLVESPVPSVDALGLAARIRATLAEPFELDNRRITLSASIGILAGAGDYDDAEDALRDARIAVGEARRVGRGGQRFFEQDMQSQARARLDLEVSLRDAVARGEFCFHLQPILEGFGERLLGAEALLRWNHPERGMVAPAEFIALAEESGLLPELHRPLLRSLLPTLAGWRRRPGFERLHLAVNFDLAQLSDPGFAEHMAVVLAEAGLPADALQVEITENVVLDSAIALRANLRELHQRGVGLMLDDFGTGFASITHLANLPLRGVKIDRSFIDQMCRDTRIAAIVRSLVELSRSLGLQVVAEGVETAEQLAMLRGLGCSALQGFLFGRPIAVEAFEQRWL